MMNSDLYDLIRYHLVPPAFLLFFTIITQVSSIKKNSVLYVNLSKMIKVMLLKVTDNSLTQCPDFPLYYLLIMHILIRDFYPIIF